MPSGGRGTRRELTAKKILIQVGVAPASRCLGAMTGRKSNGAPLSANVSVTLASAGLAAAAAEASLAAEEVLTTPLGAVSARLRFAAFEVGTVVSLPPEHCGPAVPRQGFLGLQYT